MAGQIQLELGDRFGTLVVSEIFKVPNSRGDLVFKITCSCDCGNVSDYWKCNLTSGHTVRCPECKIMYVGEKKVTHGHNRKGLMSRTYKSWSSMWDRARYPERNPNYVGISVCDRWQSFENFLADMGERPDNTSIDRINTLGNYEPDNCKWSTPKEQSSNRRAWKHTPEGLANINRNRRS